METQIINTGTVIIGENKTEIIGDKTTDLEKKFTGGLLQRGEEIDGFVIDSKMNVASGEADIYIATKGNDIKVIKYYRGNAKPKNKVLDVLKKIDNQNIIKVLSYGEYKGHAYVIMDYAKDGALDKRDEEGNYIELPLSEKKVLDIARQINEAYRVLHTDGIIQRDVKPSNIYFSNKKKNEIVIADFGISSIINEDEYTVSHKTQTTSRTTGYAAPEVLSGLITIKMDYYSLGITIWELATGKDPFVLDNGRRRNEAHLIRDTIQGRMADDLLSKEPILSKNLQHLIRGLLVIDDKKRWGYEEVSKHLNGEFVEIAKQEAKQWDLDVGDVKCRNLEELGQALADNREIGLKLVYRGIISGKLEDIYPDLISKIDSLIDEYSSKNEEEQGLQRIIWLLKPEEPLESENGYKIVNEEDIVYLILNAPEEIYPLIKDTSGRLYLYLQYLGLDSLIDEIKEIADDLDDRDGWHFMEKLYQIAVILKNKIIKPFKLERYRDFELSSLDQLSSIPKDLRNYVIILIKEKCMDGLFLPWLTLLCDKNVDWDNICTFNDLLKVINR